MNIKSKITASLLPLSVVASAQNGDRPNIIFFLMDDLGYSEVGCFGQEKIETPNIDKLAAEGKMFTQHYAGEAVSAPSRCVLLTGLHTGHAQIRGNDEMGERGDVHSHQAMFDNPKLEGQRPMLAETQTFAHILQDEGYKTACIGKWGLGYPGSDSEPNKMGFDYFYGYNCQRVSHTYYPTHLYENNERIILDNVAIQPGTGLPKGANPYSEDSYAMFNQNEYAPDLMYKATLKFIDENKDNPFFIWWTTPIPHVPLQAPKKLVDYYVEKFGDEPPYDGRNYYYPCRYPHATYAAMVTYVDIQIGGIISKLKEIGEYDNTLIIFTSDNGPTFNGGTDSPWFDSAKPFKSEQGWGKTSLREGGIRVPTIVKWSGVVEPNTTTNYISSFIDWFPTIASIVDIDASGVVDGVDLMTVLEGGEGIKRDYLYWEFPEGQGQVAVRYGDWKLYINNIKSNPEIMLFNLKDDIQELNDIAEENPKLVKKLMKIVKKEHVKSDNPLFDMPDFFDNL